MLHHNFQPDERAGIWIDRKNAFIIRVSADHSPIVSKIESGIDPPVGSHTDQTSLPSHLSHPLSPEMRQLHQRQQLAQFLDKVIGEIRDVDHVYLFGPGDMRLRLNKAIEKKGKHFSCKVLGNEPADRITQNQMQEKTRHFFTSLRYEDSLRQLSIPIS